MHLENGLERLFLGYNSSLYQRLFKAGMRDGMGVGVLGDKDLFKANQPAGIGQVILSGVWAGSADGINKDSLGAGSSF